MKRSITILLLQCLFILSSRGQSMTPAFGFEENKGQIRNQHWQPRPDVLFSGNSSGLNFHIRKDGISYQIFANNDSAAQYARTDIHWLGINPNYEIEYGCELDGYNNYYNVPLGNEPALFVRQYGSITFKNLWHGVDLIFWFNNLGQLETDWLIEPGADYKQIQFEVKGAELSISQDGYLIMDTPLGQIREGKLRVVQLGQELESAWQLQGNTVSFAVQNPNPLLAMIIDPPSFVVWATYYGGSDQEDGRFCLYTQSQEIVFGGATFSPNNIATDGAFKDSLGAYFAGFIAKFDTLGNCIWGTYFGGVDNRDFFYSGCLDLEDNIYAVGTAYSETGIATPNAHQVDHRGIEDGMISKFRIDGTLAWATYLGGG